MNFDKDFPLTSCLVEMQKMQARIDALEKVVEAAKFLMEDMYHDGIGKNYGIPSGESIDQLVNALDQLKKDL